MQKKFKMVMWYSKPYKAFIFITEETLDNFLKDIYLLNCKIPQAKR